MMLSKTTTAIICSLFVTSFSPAVADTNEDYLGTYWCADHHPYWREKNTHVEYLLVLMEDGKAQRFYSFTDYAQGAMLSFSVEHDWAVTDGMITTQNHVRRFLSGVERQDFERNTYQPLNSRVREKLKGFIDRVFTFPEPLEYNIRLTGRTIYFGDDDRYECLMSDGF